MQLASLRSQVERVKFEEEERRVVLEGKVKDLEERMVEERLRR